MNEIGKEITILGNKRNSIIERINDCTNKVNSARNSITTMSSKHTTVEQTAAKLKGAEKIKMEQELKKIDNVIEEAKNIMVLEEKTCDNYKTQ